MNNAPTTEVTFRAAYTAALGTDVPTGVIATPLLMTGVGVTKISGSVSKVSIDLKRIVARFDIENKTSSSSLTITSVHMAQGRINGSLWGVTPVENAALLTAYQPRTFKVVIPTGPKISFTSETGNYSTFDVATMYNVIGQTVKLHAVAETRKGGTAEAPTEITGSTAAVKDGDTWLTSSANVGTAAGDYTLTLGAKQTGSPLPSTTVSFASVVTPEGFTPTVIGGATWLSASEVTNGSFSVTITDATEMDTTPKTDSKTTLTNILDSSNTFEIEVVTKVPVVVP